MRIGTAEPRSTFWSQGQALAGVLSAQAELPPLEVLTSQSASIDNANRLQAGEIELGLMASNWIGRAKSGQPPFQQAVDLRMVAPMNVGPLFFIARADCGLHAFDDLLGKRVCLGAANSGMVQHAHTIFSVLGQSIDDIDPVYMSFPDGAEALKSGVIDAQFQCPIPNEVMSDLDAAIPLTVLSYRPEQLDTVLAKVAFYRRVKMPKGALRALASACEQPGVVNVLVCHARAEAGLIEAIARAILSGADDLAARNPLFQGLKQLFEPLRSQGVGALEFDGVALHPGAATAYRAAGLLG